MGAMPERRIMPLRAWLSSCGMLLASCLPIAFAGDRDAGASRLRLADAGLVVEVSPRLGGRMLHLALPAAPNLLKVGDAVAAQPDPRVDAEAGDIGYLGHQVWLGPQSHWWVHQQANPAHAFTPEQQHWLEMIRDHIAANLGMVCTTTATATVVG